MRNLIKSAGIAGLVVAAGLGLAQTASAAGWDISVGENWGWHRPYWGWAPERVIPVPEPIYVRRPVYVPEPVYVPAPAYVPVVRNEPRLTYLLDELGSQASRIGNDRAEGRLSAGSYDSLMAEDSGIRTQAIHAADVHGWLPDAVYYRMQNEVQGLNHDIAHLAS